MKKIGVYLLFVFAFLFLSTSKISASAYNGVLGYQYTSSNTTFYFYVDDENVVSVELFVNDESKGNLIYDNSGVYVITISSDLKNSEYNYKICYQDTTCVETYDPFAYTVSSQGNKNVILDTADVVVEGWDSVSYVNNDYYGTSIYAIEADKFSENINLDIIGEEVNNSVFNKLVSPATYKTLGSAASNISIGYDYLTGLGISHLEIDNLYDSNNYFYPNTKYSSNKDTYSPLREYKKLITMYKNKKINIISRTNLIEPGQKLKDSLEVMSSDFISDGKLNVENEMIKRYLIDVYKYWVNTYKVDGFYIEDASLYGQEFLNDLIVTLKGINKNIFVYTNNESEYKISDSLQEVLFGSLFTSNSEGILNGNYNEENFDRLVNNMFSGYYSNLDKYDDSKKVINNIGSFDGMDIYSKIKLIAGLGVRESEIIEKIKLGFYTIYASAGIPRVIAGNEFLNTTTIANNEIDATDEEDMVCNNSKTFCYGVGKKKTLDWKYLVTNPSELSRMMNYRVRYGHQYPNAYTMKNSISIKYDRNAISKGILFLTIEYDAEYAGETEKSILLFNYSSETVNLNKISDKDYKKVLPILGTIDDLDDETSIYGYTMFSFTEVKEKKFSEWVYILVTIGLFVLIFGIRAILVKTLKEKQGIDYNEYIKFNKQEKKNNKKNKKQNKVKETSVFETYLSDDPLLKRSKKSKEKVDIKTESKEDSESDK